jgi:type I restriction enzyme S subunit
MQLKPGYKQTEVGVIPVEWSTETLKGVSTPDGLVRGPFGGTLKKEFFVRDGFKVYEQRNAIGRDADLGAYSIDDRKYRELRRFDIKEGDFIVSCSGTIGKIFQIPKGARVGVINQALLKIETNSHVIHDRFFFYVFDWDRFQKRIIDNTHGGAMKNLVGMDVFKNIPIPLPPLPEQQGIAAALSDVDGLISGLNTLIAKKRDIKTAVMQQLLTGKTRLLGFGGVWDVKALGEVAPLQRGFDLPSSQLREGVYPVVYSNGILNHHRSFAVKAPGVVTGRSGTIGRVHYVEDDYWPHNTSLWVTDFRGNFPRFVYYLFAYIRLERFATGSGVPTLNRNDVHAYRLPLPPQKREQQAIAAILADIDAEIAALEQRRDITRALKQGMMQELLTGRIRLI